MSNSLKAFIVTTDVLFITYWIVAGLIAAGVLNISHEHLYANYSTAEVNAWNWSFFPLDIALSIMGLMAVRAAKTGDARWRPLALISLVLTMTAGLMAISYWTLLLEFNPSWYLPNLLLVIWPIFFLTDLVQPVQVNDC